MSLNITDSYLPKSTLHRPGTAIKPTKIAVHYVGNAGSSAQGNRNYFATCSSYVSSHYIIGLNGEILRLIPETEISYATNSANSYAISIECCHPDSTGKFNDKTLNALIELCADICKRRNIDPINGIIRHYDVTQKCCPMWWAPNGPNKNANSDFSAFKTKVKSAMNPVVEPPKPVKAAASKVSTFDVALKLLQNNKIVNTPEYWINASKNLNYIDGLIINAANAIYTTKQAEVNTVDAAIKRLTSKSVISTPDFWYNATKTNKYVSNLLIEVAKYV